MTPKRTQRDVKSLLLLADKFNSFAKHRGIGMPDEKKEINMKNEIFEWIKVILSALVIAILIRTFIFEPVEVKMNSMQNTLLEGQRLIAYKLGYFFSTPLRGDIIVFEHQEGTLKGFVKFLNPFPNPQEVDYIKRVIGLPGDEVDIRDGSVYLNGNKLPEAYVKGRTDKRDVKMPLVIPENKMFVLGDNREVSSDSRSSQVGLVDISKVKGRAVFRIYPFNVIGSTH